MNEKKIDDIKKKILDEEKKVNGYIFWIDQNVHNSENSSYLKSFEENHLYSKLLLDLDFFCLDNLDDALELLFNYINFKLIFIIISGRLYPEYYK